MTTISFVPVGRTKAPPRTLEEAMNSRDNALNFVRLILASSVILAHSYPLGGFGAMPFFPGTDLGQVAVAGFFAASGFLIAGSRSRLGFLPYIWRRAIRIYPAYWTALILVAFVFAPLSTLQHGQWSLNDGLGYVLRNSTLWIDHYQVGATLTEVPFVGAWNGSLWTLFYEFSAYLALGVLFFARVLRRPAALFVLFVLATVAQLLAKGPLDITTNLILHFLWLGTFFVAGSFLWSVSNRLPLSGWLGALAAALTLGALLSGHFTVLAPLPFAYLILWLGGTLPTRIGSTNDVSYGVYIYAFPIQQTLSVWGWAQAMGPVASAALALIMTTVVAWCSWVAVERPALRLKNLVPAKRHRSTATPGT